jgi:hypothetical protein
MTEHILQAYRIDVETGTNPEGDQRGNPELPSHFIAISFRCHASRVFGSDEGRYLGQHFPSQLLGLDGKPPTLIIGKPICFRRTRFSSMRYSMTCCCV